MVDPDPEKGILTRLKLEGEKQGVPLTATYDATVDLIEVLKADLDADNGPWPKPSTRSASRISWNSSCRKASRVYLKSAVSAPTRAG